ncbi:3'-5' exonuclease [Limnohabitans sp. 2KL-1]|uniref:3'-5' exonuclease n=1 Tax=Limnohabitans sp. 2KL-1 TaxID=1100699 RepID=UPI000D339137|nr:3'-5' exonuclease [Limnohabitans sp. 2KL-1]
MKGCKGLELPVVVLPGVGLMPATGKDEQEAVRVLFYVATTRTKQRLVIGVGRHGAV